MTPKLIDSMTTSIVAAIKVITAPLVARIEALEAKPHVKFCGVWKAGTAYAPGDAVTQKGGLWICKAETSGAPGVDYVAWVLAVKSGHAQ